MNLLVDEIAELIEEYPDCHCFLANEEQIKEEGIQLILADDGGDSYFLVREKQVFAVDDEYCEYGEIGMCLGDELGS